MPRPTSRRPALLAERDRGQSLRSAGTQHPGARLRDTYFCVARARRVHVDDGGGTLSLHELSDFIDRGHRLVHDGPASSAPSRTACGRGAPPCARIRTRLEAPAPAPKAGDDARTAPSSTCLEPSGRSSGATLMKRAFMYPAQHRPSTRSRCIWAVYNGRIGTVRDLLGDRHNDVNARDRAATHP